MIMMMMMMMLVMVMTLDDPTCSPDSKVPKLFDVYCAGHRCGN
jgi:hypothetical protein